MRLLPFICFATVIAVAATIVIGFVTALTPISDFDYIRTSCQRHDGIPVEVTDAHGDIIAIRCDIP